MNSSELVNLVFSSTDMKQFLQSLSSEGITAIYENKKLKDKLNQAINNVISRQPDQVVQEQLETIVSEIKRELKKQIEDRNIWLLGDIKAQILEKLNDETYEIPMDIREGLAENLQCEILNAIKEIDFDFANELKLAKSILEESIRNDRQDRQIEQNKERIQQTESDIRTLRRVIDEKVKIVESPIAVRPACPHIDDSEKLIARPLELQEIENKYASGSNVIFLCGRPGMGKSTLAKCYAKSVCEKQDIYFVAYENSIEYTVGKLAKAKIREKGKKVLEYFQSTQEDRPILLIIDNFNEDILQGQSRRRVEEELNEDFYRKLINSGIRVLFTTRIKRDRDSIEIKPLDNPIELFKRYYGEAVEDENLGKVRELINLVQKNTLLIILSARLLKYADTPDKIDDILNRLQEGDMQSELTELECYADIRETDAFTIYSQVDALLDMSGIQKEGNAKRVFANTVLLPLEGMERLLFLDMICGNTETSNALRHLMNGNWVLTDSKRIYLHPLVREIAIRRQMVSYESCELYCQNIGKKIEIDNNKKFEERVIYKNYAQTIFNMFGTDAVLKKELVRLIYDLSDIYDELGERRHSRELIQVVEKHLNVFDEVPLEKAEILSGIAFSLNNKYEGMETLERAEEILKTALYMIENISEEERDSTEYNRVKGKILNNFGSNGLAKREYYQKRSGKSLETALGWHKKSLKLREEQFAKLAFSEDTNAVGTASTMLANSYTAMGTDCFYLFQFDEAIKWHTRALEVRESLENNKGMTISQERIVGSIIEMYKHDLGIETKYISQALDYYPQLLQLNYKHENVNALKTNIQYFCKLRNIVENDRRLEEFLMVIEEKRNQIKELVETDEKLKAIVTENVSVFYKWCDLG